MSTKLCGAVRWDFNGNRHECDLLPGHKSGHGGGPAFARYTWPREQPKQITAHLTAEDLGLTPEAFKAVVGGVLRCTAESVKTNKESSMASVSKKYNAPLVRDLPDLDAALEAVEREREAAIKACERTWRRGRVECRVVVRRGDGDSQYAAVWRASLVGLGEATIGELTGDELDFVARLRHVYERWCKREVPALPPSLSEG